MTRIPFKFIDPDQAGDDELVERLGLREDAKPLARDAISLADSAQYFFIGGFPIETPHFAWGELLLLPWKKDYEPWWDGSTSGEIVHPTIRPQVYRISAQILARGKDDGLWGRSYLCGFEGDMAITQGLAVEAMLQADSTLEFLSTGNVLAAASALSDAYKNIIECTCKAQLILGMSATQKARAAADIRHGRNREMKAKAFEWLDENRTRFDSMDAAATALAGPVVHVAWRTARTWITEWHRERK